MLPPGSTIPVTHTQSTIPADLLQNVLRLPYRERLTLIINELGAGVAGRSGDLQAALRRAVPALTETDNLLNLLAERLTHAAAADGERRHGRHRAGQQQAPGAAVHHRGEQHRDRHRQPAGEPPGQPRAAAGVPRAAAPGDGAARRGRRRQPAGARQPERVRRRSWTVLFTDLPPFSRAALPAVRSLGQRVGHRHGKAVQAAAPTVDDLNAFAQPTPELAQNLAIVLHDLDDRGRAVEPDARSPGGKGYTGLEALLQYVFNQTLAINTFGPFGHLLAVDAFVDPKCSPYATPATIALSLKQFGPSYRQCYAWLGPNQPGVNETDPSNPRACVPDPGGAPPGERGPQTTSACKLTAPIGGRTASGTPRRRPRAGPASGGRGGRQPRRRRQPRRGPSRAPGAARPRRLLNYLLAP